MRIKKPILYTYDLEKKLPTDLLAVVHIDDRNNDVLEIHLTQGKDKVELDNVTVTARMVTRKTHVLLSDAVPCTVNEAGNILVPFDNAVIGACKGDLTIEINIENAAGELTLQFPLWVRVNDTILSNAEVTPDSKGTIPELLERVEEQLERVDGFATKTEMQTALQNKQDVLPRGTENELVHTDSWGGMRRSGYRITSNENVIADRPSADAFVPNARAVAKVINSIPSIKGEPGDSAYEIAVAHGYSGTEEQWLASLKGADGDDYVLTTADKQVIAQLAAALVDISGKEDIANKAQIADPSAEITAQDAVMYPTVKLLKELYRLVRDTLLPSKADSSAVYTKAQIDGMGFATVAYVIQYVAEHGGSAADIYAAIDEMFADPDGNSTGITVELIQAAQGEEAQYWMVYYDSEGDRHTLYNLSAVFAAKAAVPTKTSDLTNDSTFQTKAQVDSAIQLAIGGVENGAY